MTEQNSGPIVEVARKPIFYHDHQSKTIHRPADATLLARRPKT